MVRLIKQQTEVNLAGGKKMTKRERRQAQLERHYSALVRLAEACGVKKADGKKLSVALLKIERKAHVFATWYCNGQTDSGAEYFTEQWDTDTDAIEKEVQALFNNKLPHLRINGDCRGYALKISNDSVDPIIAEQQSQLIEKTGLQRDWGGYGLLAPEITGN